MLSLPQHSKGIPETDQDGNIIRIIGTFQDITEKVLKDKELSLILENSRIGIWKFNPVSNELVWDKSMYDLFEVNPDDFSGAFDAWTSTLDESSKVTAPQDFQKALEGNGHFESSFKIITPSGAIKSIGARGIIDRNAAGEAIL